MILFSVKIRKYCLESGLGRLFFLQHFGAKNRFAKPARAQASLLYQLSVEQRTKTQEDGIKV